MLFIIIGVVSIIDEENKYKNSVKEEVVTIQSISPAPGLNPNDFGQLMVTNADQIMFYTSDGRGFENTEDEVMGKYETRDLLINLKLGGTYKIKYVGWRDGQNSRFPNILAITEIKNETYAISFSWNDFLGDWNLKDVAKFNFANYVDGVFVGDNANIDADAYKNQTLKNKQISDGETQNV